MVLRRRLTDVRMADHPCPRRRHHPGEKCLCALRLDVSVPHGYSRVADMGSLHASRLQNLRWRLGPCPKTQAELPLSLRALAKDHLGDAVAVTVRPLSPPRIARKALHCPPEHARLRRSRSVCFDTDLVAEVPHLTQRRSPLIEAMSNSSVAPDLRVNQNMARLLENHQNQVLDCGCFSFLWAPTREPRRPSSGSSTPSSIADAVSLEAVAMAEASMATDVMPLAAGGLMYLPPQARGVSRGGYCPPCKISSPSSPRLPPSPSRSRSPNPDVHGSPEVHWSSAGRLAALTSSP